MRWFFLLFFFILSPELYAQTQHLRVVTDNNYPPYVYLNVNGQPEGYVVDIWKLWEQKTGVPVDLQVMQWSIAQRTILDGESDAIDMIFRTPVREQLYDYSEPYASLPVSIYVASSINGITDVPSLQGFTIGVQNGDACADKLVSLGIDNLISYPNYESILAAAKAGDIKMFCMDDVPANYYLYLYRDQLSFTKAFTLYEGHFHWAVSRGDKETYKLVEQGMKLITPEERLALQEKWFKQPIEFKAYVRIVLILIFGSLVILAAASLWIWFLRRLVNKRTVEIQLKNQQLEIAHRDLLFEKTQLRTIVESSPDAMSLKDKDGVYIFCNSGTQRLLGMPQEKIIGHTADDLTSDKEYAAFVSRTDQEILQSGIPTRYEQKIVTAAGESRDFDVVKVPIRSSGDEIVSILTVLRDITEIQRAEQELRIASVAFESHDGMIITDALGVIERVNSAFSQITGYEASEVIGKKLTFLKSGLHEHGFFQAMWDSLHATGYWASEVINRHKNGSLFTARLSISSVPDAQGKTIHYIGNLQDITEEKQVRALAEHLKLFDQLTDLPNRALFEEHMRHALKSSEELNEYGAVIMLDLDFFQKINDSLGHAVGDLMLNKIAQRIRSTLENSDMLCRFSGDAFVVLSVNLGADQHHAITRALNAAEAIRLAIAKPMTLQEHHIICSGSIGISLFLGDQTQPEVLLRQAELAMYKSKRNGRNTIRFFEESMQAELDHVNWLERELREAIQKNQLALYYQVQVDAQKQPLGAEALIRWIHPERGIVSPADFIPLAEETGLIEPIGRWVIATACQQLAEWSQSSDLNHLTLAVNISPRQFKSEHFVEDILEQLIISGATPSMLKLEVTESLAIDDFESSIVKLETLRAKGLRISLDDFGTGNSSLNYLTKLPLTQLKIDKSFVDEIPTNHRDVMVAQTIIAMGHGLELNVIAEGVETQAQYDLLVAQGCNAFQGYLFGKPQTLNEFEDSIRKSMPLRG